MGLRSKQCKMEGCNRPVWSNGLCINHTPKTTISSRRVITLSNKRKQKEEVSVMRDFFFSIWNERSHYCENCGKWLGNEPLSYMFDHLLEKSKFPELKYEDENIMLVCLDCHDNKTRGFYSELVLNRINEVKSVFRVV